MKNYIENEKQLEVLRCYIAIRQQIPETDIYKIRVAAKSDRLIYEDKSGTEISVKKVPDQVIRFANLDTVSKKSFADAQNFVMSVSSKKLDQHVIAKGIENAFSGFQVESVFCGYLYARATIKLRTRPYTACVLSCQLTEEDMQDGTASLHERIIHGLVGNFSSEHLKNTMLKNWKKKETRRLVSEVADELSSRIPESSVLVGNASFENILIQCFFGTLVFPLPPVERWMDVYSVESVEDEDALYDQAFEREKIKLLSQLLDGDDLVPVSNPIQEAVNLTELALGKRKISEFICQMNDSRLLNPDFAAWARPTFVYSMRDSRLYGENNYGVAVLVPDFNANTVSRKVAVWTPMNNILSRVVDKNLSDTCRIYFEETAANQGFADIQFVSGAGLLVGQTELSGLYDGKRLHFSYDGKGLVGSVKQWGIISMFRNAAAKSNKECKFREKIAKQELGDITESFLAHDIAKLVNDNPEGINIEHVIQILRGCTVPKSVNARCLDDLQTYARLNNRDIRDVITRMIGKDALIIDSKKKNRAKLNTIKPGKYLSVLLECPAETGKSVKTIADALSRDRIVTDVEADKFLSYAEAHPEMENYLRVIASLSAIGFAAKRFAEITDYLAQSDQELDQYMLMFADIKEGTGRKIILATLNELGRKRHIQKKRMAEKRKEENARVAANAKSAVEDNVLLP